MSPFACFIISLECEVISLWQQFVLAKPSCTTSHPLFLTTTMLHVAPSIFLASSWGPSKTDKAKQQRPWRLMGVILAKEPCIILPSLQIEKNPTEKKQNLFFCLEVFIIKSVLMSNYNLRLIIYQKFYEQGLKTWYVISIWFPSHLGTWFENQSMLFFCSYKNTCKRRMGDYWASWNHFLWQVFCSIGKGTFKQRLLIKKRGVYFSGLSLLYGLVTLLGDIWRGKLWKICTTLQPNGGFDQILWIKANRVVALILLR